MAPSGANFCCLARGFGGEKNSVVPWGSWCGKDLSGVGELTPHSCLCSMITEKGSSSSVIIDHLQDRVVHTGGRVLYFYFDYPKKSEQTPLKILATLLKQLITTDQGVPEGASKLFENIVSGKGLPSWNLLVNAFIGTCAHSEEVFLILDAMDECDEHKNRSDILDLLDRLEEQSQLRILITSRSYPSDIKEAFAEYPEIVIQASDSDIHTFLSGMILNSRRRWVKRVISGGLRERIIHEIAGKSQGMSVSEQVAGST
jgi:hypothetical protein